MNKCDVVIIGAGIGGAVLSLALGSRGWKIRLLERELHPAHIARPEVLWGATPAALDRFGVGDIIRNTASVRLDGVEFTSGSRQLLTLSPDVLRRAKVEAYSTDPGLTREVIAAAATATGNVTFERGVEVQQVIREDGQILGVQASRNGAPLVEHARLVVGDDGAHSVVRSALMSDSRTLALGAEDQSGTSMKLRIFPLDFITAAIAWPKELPTNRVRIWIDLKAFRMGIPAVGCLPWPGGRGVLLIPLPHVRAEALLHNTPEAFWTTLSKLSPLAMTFSEQLKFPGDFRHFRRPFGHAPRYVADGAAIIGDAAHPVSPAGGQGANAAIWDALTLADVAHEALTADDVSRKRLSRYEALRRPRNRDSLAITKRVALVLRCGSFVPGLRWFVPTVLRCIDCMPTLKSSAVSSFATTFVTR